MSSLSRDKKSAVPFGKFNIKDIRYGSLKINKKVFCIKKVAIFGLIAYILIGLIVAKIISP